MSKRKEREMRLYKGWIEKIKEVTEMFKRMMKRQKHLDVQIVVRI